MDSSLISPTSTKNTLTNSTRYFKKLCKQNPAACDYRGLYLFLHWFKSSLRSYVWSSKPCCRLYFSRFLIFPLFNFKRLMMPWHRSTILRSQNPSFSRGTSTCIWNSQWNSAQTPLWTRFTQRILSWRQWWQLWRESHRLFIISKQGRPSLIRLLN